jgi:hypothetical protein
MSSMALKSPVTSLILGDFWRSFCADADCAFRVTASISKGASAFSSALMTDPPCLPVAPVMRSAREAILVKFEGQSCDLWYCGGTVRDAFYLHYFLSDIYICCAHSIHFHARYQELERGGMILLRWIGVSAARSFLRANARLPDAKVARRT